MPLDIAAIQRALTDDGLDGWLLYDFHGSNPIAVSLAGVAGRHVTRRWYYFIPRTGAPAKLVHTIEAGVLASLPGSSTEYAGRTQLESGLRTLLAGARTIAMEYSPKCAIPYIARVDAGTIELVRDLGVEVVSSGDLVGRFEAAWDAAAIGTHRAASNALYRVKDRAFSLVAAELSAGRTPTEIEVQRAMMRWFGEEGLVTDSPPIVSVNAHAGDPHYAPTSETSAPIRRGDLLLLDLWGKLDRPRAVYADITWTGVYGEPPAEVARVFGVVAAARDAALAAVQRAIEGGQVIRGWEVDREARDVVAAAGYGTQFVHRTGHSLGEEVHGNGVHMDDYETHDDRRLMPGTGFTIEPGIYTSAFGIRSEINVVVTETAAEPTGPSQQALVRIDRLPIGETTPRSAPS
ncbi:MAG: M24 family metallopeptidase [Acidobacteriota bacterium]